MRPKTTWLAVAWTLIVFGICWTPRTMMPVAEDLPKPFLLQHLDKVVHFGAFAVFGLAWIAAAPGRAGRVTAAGVAAAVLSELGQATPLVNRDAEWGDGLADVLGVFAGQDNPEFVGSPLSEAQFRFWLVAAIVASLVVGVVGTIVPLRIGIKAFRRMEL